jgi:NAD(P)H-dependent flavin oxidoreductase YrpB (nitropropane dioxygenase family)
MAGKSPAVTPTKGTTHMVTPMLRGMSLPVIGVPMFIVSNPELVIAQCINGVVGSFPALNARLQAALDNWLAAITSKLDAGQPQGRGGAVRRQSDHS